MSLMASPCPSKHCTERHPCGLIRNVSNSLQGSATRLLGEVWAANASMCHKATVGCGASLMHSLYASQMWPPHHGQCLGLAVQNLQQAPLPCQQQQGHPCRHIYRPLDCVEFLVLLHRQHARDQFGQQQQMSTSSEHTGKAMVCIEEKPYIIIHVRLQDLNLASGHAPVYSGLHNATFSRGVFKELEGALCEAHELWYLCPQ